MKKLSYQTIINKLKFWQKALKIGDWDISIKIARESYVGEGIIAEVIYCAPVEKIAKINLLNNYMKVPGYNISFNIDTIIIHELIHVVLWDKVNFLPTKFRKNKRYIESEEFICDYMAKVIYDGYKKF